jgi:putative endonuclease
VETGASAEDVATRFLLDHDYTIVERNYRCQSGELDIIARDGDVLVFVEVRSRADDEHGDPIESVNRRKQAQVARVAAHYLHHKCPQLDDCRFDVVTILGGQVDLYQDAWRGGLL